MFKILNRNKKIKSDELDINNLPKHIGIIMDGNGRWAKKRGLPRSAGHRAGAKVLEQITRDAGHLGIRFLTVYAFSTENWKRPSDEVEALMKLSPKTATVLKDGKEISVPKSRYQEVKRRYALYKGAE